MTFPSIYDPSMRTMIAFGGKYPTTVIPSTVVLDREHRVAVIFLRELLAGTCCPWCSDWRQSRSLRRNPPAR